MLCQVEYNPIPKLVHGVFKLSMEIDKVCSNISIVYVKVSVTLKGWRMLSASLDLEYTSLWVFFFFFFLKGMRIIYKIENMFVDLNLVWANPGKV